MYVTTPRTERCLLHSPALSADNCKDFCSICSVDNDNRPGTRCRCTPVDDPVRFYGLIRPPRTDRTTFFQYHYLWWGVPALGMVAFTLCFTAFNVELADKNYLTETYVGWANIAILALCCFWLLMTCVMLLSERHEFRLLFFNRPVLSPSFRAIHETLSDEFNVSEHRANSLAILKNGSVIFKYGYWGNAHKNHFFFTHICAITDRVPEPMIYFVTVAKGIAYPSAWLNAREWFGPGGVTLMQEFAEKNKLPFKVLDFRKNDEVRFHAACVTRIQLGLHPYQDRPLRDSDQLRTFLPREPSSFPAHDRHLAPPYEYRPPMRSIHARQF